MRESRSASLRAAPASGNGLPLGSDHSGKNGPPRSGNGLTTSNHSRQPRKKSKRKTISWWKTLTVGLIVCWLDAIYILYHLEGSTVEKSLPSTNTSTAVPPMSPPRQITPDGIATGSQDRIYELLKDAGIDVNSLSQELRDELPTWQQVSELYGSDPIFVGLERCADFRAHSDPPEHFVSTAGTFNTGTNLMAELLIKNCHMPARMEKYGAVNRGVRWQVPWGKHTPVDDEDFRKTHKTDKDANIEADNVLAGVTIRDPGLWMPSMCRHAYAMHWQKEKDHCPNLLEEDGGLVPVRIDYAKFTRTHASMVHHWNEWYQNYLQAPWPRVLIRFEDLIFHPRNVTQTICECAGGELNDKPFQYIVDSAKVGKAHGTEKTGYVDAIAKYGKDRHRWKGMTNEDLDFARSQLDPDLMKLFRYRPPQAPS